MPPKTTNAQYKNKLAYNSGTQPAFLRALQARLSGKPDPTLRNRNGDDDDEDAGDWEQLDSNRPAIPRRPDDASQSAGAGNSKHDEDEEDFDDERPTVVVLKEGKHLTAFEVTNEKRRLKGLPPLPPPETSTSTSEDTSKPATSLNPKNAAANPSQANVSLGGRATQKRKLDTSDSTKAKDGEKAKPSSGKAKGDSKDKAPVKKKAKKESKNLLSFGDE